MQQTIDVFSNKDTYREKKARQDADRYSQLAENHAPASPLAIDCVKAFLVGGLICMLGQAINDLGITLLQLNAESAALFTTIILVFLGAFFTGLGLYDDLGKFAGAGSIVPITGFANSIVSPAMEFKREGFVFGAAAKLFAIAGPVIVYGVGASMIYGLIYYFLK